jgi:hypothetical protein
VSRLNLKHVSIIFLVLFALLLSISAISANDNATDDIVGEIEDAGLEKSVDSDVLANESTNTNTATSTNTNTNTTDNSKTTQSDAATPKKVKVTAPEVFNVYKKKGSFKITVKDSNKNPVKKLKLKVKVYTGKKYKTYTIKTNSKGVATLNTNKLKKGTHKVVITSGNKNYNITKKSKIHIGVKKSLTLAIGQVKNFKNGDYFRFFKQTKDGQYNRGVYVENLRIYKGSLVGAKSHNIIKVKYTFKNIKGITITKISKSEDMFRTNPIIGYEPITAKIWYLEE